MGLDGNKGLVDSLANSSPALGGIGRPGDSFTIL